MSSQGGTSRLAQMQMRFQQKQQQEREQRKLDLATTTMGDINTSNSKVSLINATNGRNPGKVRQMFDQRRQRSTGIDKSYPLKPLAPRSGPASVPIATRNPTPATLRKQVAPIKQINGKTKKILEENGDDDNIVIPISRQNGNTIASHKNQYMDLDSIDDEQFPETHVPFDDEIHPVPPSKLTNYGKLASLAIGDRRSSNANKIMTNGDDNNNSSGKRSLNVNSSYIKLKPLPASRTGSSSGSSSASTDVSEKLSRISIDDGYRTKTPTPASNTVRISTPTKLSPRQNSQTNSKSTSVSNKNPSPIRRPPVKVNKSSSPETKIAMRTEPPENSEACRVCGRYFLKDRIEKHEPICQKAAQKRRKIFDAAKHRVQGTEAEKYLKKPSKNSNSRTSISTKKVTSPDNAPAAATSKKSDWRRKHEEFIAAIRAAKEMQAHLARGGKVSDLPPPPPSENPDYIQCPHCSRRFNEAAASRHIPKCATMLHNKPKPGAQLKKKR